jgi:membrane protein
MDVLPPWIQRLKVFEKIVAILQSIRITKDKVSLAKVSYIFLLQLKKDSIQEKASSMAFNFTLSIFPLVIFLFTLIPYIPVPNLQHNIMSLLKDVMPLSLYEVSENTILEIISIQRGGLLSFGFILAIYAATNGVVSMIVSFNKCYRTAETRGYFSRFFLALTLVFIITLTLIVSISLGLLFSYYLHYLDKILTLDNRFYIYIVLIFKYFVLVFIFWLIISLIYYIAPNLSKRWRFLSIGSFVAAFLGVAFTLGFTYYIENFDSYNKVYGSIGTLIGMLIWLFVMSYVLLIGFEINASIDQACKEQARRNRLDAEKTI